MTKLGWAILIVIVMGATAFLSMLRIGGPARSPVRDTTQPQRRVADAADPEGVHHRASLVVPVAGVARKDLYDSWGDPRENGKRLHHGTDIPAPRGTPVVAAADGRIEKLFDSDLGGTTVYERSADGGREYYYAHLSGYAPGLREGQRVRAGETIAYVGDSGDAGPGNYHLHFGVSLMQPGDGWWQGRAVNPYPLLASVGGAR